MRKRAQNERNCCKHLSKSEKGIQRKRRSKYLDLLNEVGICVKGRDRLLPGVGGEKVLQEREGMEADPEMAFADKSREIWQAISLLTGTEGNS